MSIVSKFLGPWIIKDAWWEILQSNMGEEITNGVSDVLKELYGVLELMTVYILGCCWLSLRWCWTSGHGRWGINEK